MHELSVAYSIVEVVENAAREANVEKVEAVHLRLGLLSGVVKDALLFGYEIAAADTILEGSRLEIEEVPVVVHCPTCDVDVMLEDVQLFRCPVCGTRTADVVSGRELEIKSLEYEE